MIFRKKVKFNWLSTKELTEHSNIIVIRIQYNVVQYVRTMSKSRDYRKNTLYLSIHS